MNEIEKRIIGEMAKERSDNELQLFENIQKFFQIDLTDLMVKKIEERQEQYKTIAEDDFADNFDLTQEENARLTPIFAKLSTSDIEFLTMIIGRDKDILA